MRLKVFLFVLLGVFLVGISGYWYFSAQQKNEVNELLKLSAEQQMRVIANSIQLVEGELKRSFNEWTKQIPTNQFQHETLSDLSSFSLLVHLMKNESGLWKVNQANYSSEDLKSDWPIAHLLKQISSVENRGLTEEVNSGIFNSANGYIHVGFYKFSQNQFYFALLPSHVFQNIIDLNRVFFKHLFIVNSSSIVMVHSERRNVGLSFSNNRLVYDVIVSNDEFGSKRLSDSDNLHSFIKLKPDGLFLIGEVSGLKSGSLGFKTILFLLLVMLLISALVTLLIGYFESIGNIQKQNVISKSVNQEQESSDLKNKESELNSIPVKDNKVVQLEKRRNYNFILSKIVDELKNPLTSLMGQVQLFRGKVSSLEPEANKYLENIENIARKTSHLINQLMYASGSDQFKFKRFSLSDLVDEIIQVYRAALKQGNVSLEAEITPNINLVGHHELVKMALKNIVNNAIESMETVKAKALKISLNMKENSNSALFKVVDSGLGCGDLSSDILYEPFFSTKSHDEHVGLGLSVVLGVVCRHEGILKIHKNTGSEFSTGVTVEIEWYNVNVDSKQDNEIENEPQLNVSLETPQISNRDEPLSGINSESQKKKLIFDDESTIEPQGEQKTEEAKFENKDSEKEGISFDALSASMKGAFQTDNSLELKTEEESQKEDEFQPVSLNKAALGHLPEGLQVDDDFLVDENTEEVEIQSNAPDESHVEDAFKNIDKDEDDNKGDKRGEDIESDKSVEDIENDKGDDDVFILDLGEEVKKNENKDIKHENTDTDRESSDINKNENDGKVNFSSEDSEKVEEGFKKDKSALNKFKIKVRKPKGFN